MTAARKPAPGGLKGDSDAFAAMTEISIIAHLAENAFARVLPEGLTVAQFGVLNHLMRLGRHETISELASAMQVAQPTMSSTVRKLEEKGLVTLVPDEADRRIRRVAVTAAGRKVRGQSVRTLTKSQGALLGEISPAKWKTLLPLLTELRVLLDEAR